MKIFHLLILTIIITNLTQAHQPSNAVTYNFQKGLPIINICQKYRLLVDTGSQEVWLADTACKNCYQTLALCPFIKETTKSISYFKGYAKGDYTFLNTCFDSQKILCVKQTQNLNNFQAHGILGIKGNSTGKTFLTNYLKHINASSFYLAFYQGLKQNKLFLGNTPEKYKKQFLISTNKDWNLSATSISISNSSTLSINCTAHFDTGSNIVILQTKLYEFIAAEIKQIMLQENCFQSQKPLQFKCYSKRLNLDNQFKIYLTNQQKQQLQFHLPISRLLKIQQNLFQFNIEKTEKNVIILGISAFKGYLVEFHMNGTLMLYQSNQKQLAQLERYNFKWLLFEYILLVFTLSFLTVKIYRFIDQKINKKIVI